MSSLRERLDQLERDLCADPPRICAYHDLPFAIFWYPPDEEYPLRKELGFLATRLGNASRRVTVVSLSEMMWTAIRETEGVDQIARAERELGFEVAQNTVTTLLSDAEFRPLPVELTRRMDPHNRHMVVLRPVSGKGADAIILANAIYETVHPRMVQARFLRMVQRPDRSSRAA